MNLNWIPKGGSCVNVSILQAVLSDGHNYPRYIAEIEHRFREILTVTRKSTEFWNAFQACPHDMGRLRLVKEHFEWVPLNPNVRAKLKKSQLSSTAFQDFGNTAFRKKNFGEALRLYNIAVAFAPPTLHEPELALAFANRSSALHCMNLHEEALEDIDLALANGYPRDRLMRKKLAARKRKLEKALAERVKNPSFKQYLVEESQSRNRFYEQLFTLESPNPLAPDMIDALEIKWNPEKGRHVVANKDIPMGTTLVVEKPYTAVLDRALTWETDHCHYCWKHQFRLIPCPTCVFALFCNEECRDKAKEFHQYECHCLPELHSILLGDRESNNFHLVFKYICQLGPQKLYELFCQSKERTGVFRPENAGENENHSHGDTNGILGIDPETGIYSSESHWSSYHLIQTPNPQESYRVFLIALTLTEALHQKSKFFDPVVQDNAERVEFQYFVTQMYVHYFATCERNTYGLSKISGLDGVNLRTYHGMEATGVEQPVYAFEPFAFGLYATICLINHSCDPNVIRFTGKKFGRMAVVALRSLKKNQELLISYGQLCCTPEETTTAQRRKELIDNYKFFCTCIGCKNDWPRYEELMRMDPIFCCPLCASEFPHESKMSDEFLKCVLVAGDFKCHRCNTQYIENVVQREFERQNMGYNMCLETLVWTNNPPVGTVDYIKSLLQYFENHVAPPVYQYFDAAHLLRDMTNLVIYFSDTGE